MTLQAIIMAGGEGVRLRPLTAHLPKPLVPLLGEPAMGYAIQLLKQHGVREIGVSLWYQPQKIREAFGRGEKYGVRLKYYEELEPLGTAGSVKMAQKELKSTFFVLSGDGLTDCDLTQALRFHREKKALATLVLKRVCVPLPYGVVMTEADGRITRFIEKPGWSRVYNDLVNTGTYILEPEIFDYIADSGMPDFGKDVFPSLAAQGLPIYGFETADYWCDIGSLTTYLQAQRDLMENKVKLPFPDRTHESAMIHPTARIEGNCFIGPDVQIGAGAVIADSVLGEGCRIGEGARVTGSCLWKNAVVKRKANISGSVLCDGATVREGAEIAEGCAVGKQASVGAYAILRPGIQVCPYGKAESGTVVTRNVCACGEPLCFSAQGTECETPENVCDLCRAYAAGSKPRSVLTGRRAGAGVNAVAGGALASLGADVYDAGETTEPMFRCLLRLLGLDGGVFIDGQRLRFYQDGKPLTAKQYAKLNSVLRRSENVSQPEMPGKIIALSGMEAVYLSAILPKHTEKPLFSPIAVFCDNGALTTLAKEGLKRIGARDVRAAPVADAAVKMGETGFLLTDSGESVTVFTAERILSSEDEKLLLLSLERRKGEMLYDLPGLPGAAQEIAPLKAPDDSPGCVRQETLLSDGAAALLYLAEALKNGPMETLIRDVPKTYVNKLDVPCGVNEKSRVLRMLRGQIELPFTLGDGIRIQHKGGFAHIVPDADRASVRIASESGDSEFARELCDFYARKIQKLANTAQQ